MENEKEVEQNIGEIADALEGIQDRLECICEEMEKEKTRAEGRTEVLHAGMMSIVKAINDHSQDRTRETEQS